MKTNAYVGKFSYGFRLVSMILLTAFLSISAFSANKSDGTTRFEGVITDSKSKEALAFTNVIVAGTNIATVCNSDGEFSLKVPNEHLDKNVMFSHIGYQTATVPLRELKTNEINKITLNMTSVSLVEVNVFPSDPERIVREMIRQRDANYSDFSNTKTAFYRETIKKGRNYVSLTEAVLDIFKFPYSAMRDDRVKLILGRKSADYDKLDTLVFKLQGGPVSAVMLDIMKEPYALFDDETIRDYSFELSNITKVDDRLLYIIDFKQRESVDKPLFFGKLYVDMESLALTRAEFNMDVSNREEATALFIRRKPSGARVYPTEASYIVDYRITDGKWHYGYARASVAFRVNWKKKLLNTNYYTTMEMAVTDWKIAEDQAFKASERLKPTIIMEDAVEGFNDPDFWGDYNVIEPEQPIENAIKRIQRNLDK